MTLPSFRTPSASTRARRESPGLAWIPTVSATVLVLIALLQLPADRVPIGFPLDDAWIHATYARNLVEHGEWSFNPGTPSTGATSPLWVVLIAFTYAVTGTMPASMMALGTLSLLLFMDGWYRLVTLLLRSRTLALTAALLTLGSGVLLWWSLSGMETVLFLAVATYAVGAMVTGRWRAAGVWSAILVLVRPEGVALAAAAAAVLVFNGRRQRLHPLLWTVIPAAAAGAVLVTMNLLVTGEPWPNTLEGRRWLAGVRTSFPGPPTDAFAHAYGILHRIAGVVYRSLHPAGSHPWLLAAVIGTAALWMGTAAAIFRSTLLERRVRRHPSPAPLPAAARTRRLGLRIAALWIALHTAAYVLIIPTAGHGLRYMAPLLPTAVLVLCAAAAWIWRMPARSAGLRRLRLSLTILASFVAVAGALRVTSIWLEVHRSNVSHIERVHVQSAQWCATGLPADSRIACFDIGAMGFFSRHHIIDLGGLIDTRVLPAMQTGRIDEWIRESRADAVAMMYRYDEAPGHPTLSTLLGFTRSGMLELDPVYVAACPERAWTFAVRYSSNAYPILKIWKVKAK